MEVRLGDTTVHIVKMRMKNFSGRTEGDQGYTRLRLLKHTVFSGTGDWDKGVQERDGGMES